MTPETGMKKGAAWPRFWVLAAALFCSVWAVGAVPWDNLQAHSQGDALLQFNLAQGSTEALREGQFPIREFPRVLIQTEPVYRRYGIFQFYGNFAGTLSGLLGLGGVNPWHAVVLLAWFGYFCGFLGAVALAREAGAESGASVAAGILYILAPFNLVALSYRAAMSELCVLGILPWVFALGVRVARRNTAASLAAAGLAWAALMHAHHVFHAWAVPFYAGLLGLFALRETGSSFRVWRAFAAYGLGLALSAWYVFPGALVGSHFLWYIYNPNPVTDVLHDLGLLLTHPWLNPFLGPAFAGAPLNQPGWPLLVGAMIFAARKGRECRRSPFLWVFLAAFLLVWGPIDILRWLGPMRMIQEKARLTIYLVLFGSVIAAQGMPRLSKAGQRALPIALIFLHIILHAPYRDISVATPYRVDEICATQAKIGLFMEQQPYDCELPQAEIERVWTVPDMEIERAAPLRSYSLEPGLEVLSPAGPPSGKAAYGPVTRISLGKVAPGSLALLPAPWYPGLYRVEINGRETPYGRVRDRLAVELPGGEAELSYRLVGYAWANWISLAAWIFLLAGIVLYQIRKYFRLN